MPSYVIRMVLLFIIGAATVLYVRTLLVPESFWALGHYRANALGDITEQQPRHLKKTTCDKCHDDDTFVKMAHARVPCQTCHGNDETNLERLQAHVKAQNADEDNPPKPNKAIVREFCLRCHEKSLARPPQHPQIDPKVHKEDEKHELETDCKKCHTIHEEAKPKSTRSDEAPSPGGHSAGPSDGPAADAPQPPQPSAAPGAPRASAAPKG